MKRLVGMVLVAALLCGFPNTQADDPEPQTDRETQRDGRPREPAGILSNKLGTYLTIEGKRYDGPPVMLNRKRLLVVDTVNGKPLQHPVTVSIKNLSLPEKQRCVFKGYESGEMIGLPPAVIDAANELGKKVPPIQAGWQWRPHFVVLVVNAPQQLKVPDSDSPFIRP